MVGRQSILYDNPVYIYNGATAVGTKEGKGPLGDMFDVVSQDDTFGENSWEEAESKLQQLAVDKLMVKCGFTPKDFDYIFAGDLLGQLIATSFGLMKYDLAMFGLYGACSTMGEALSLGSMCVNAGYSNRVISLASSHFASAEKQFRYPLEYGNQRPMASTWTVTGCGAYVVSSEAGEKAVRISGITTGKIVDYGVKDSMNMGACMAPAAAQLIEANFRDLNVNEDYYDAIYTGDLGRVGNTILCDLLKEKGINMPDKLRDCGIEIYSEDMPNAYSGGSGCGCSAVVLNALIIPKLLSGLYKRVLFVPTGALLSTVSYNEGRSVPSIAHGVILERGED